MRGTFLVTQNDRELVLKTGDATVISCAQTGSYLQPDTGRLICVRLPRAALTPFLPNPEERAGELIPGSLEPLRLLKAYAGTLVADDDLAVSPAVSRAVVNHLCDLVALALGSKGDGAAQAGARGLRAARMQAAKAFIDSRLGSPELSIQAAANHLAVTTRYVRKLFEAEGRSFSGYVMDQRLTRAHAMLAGVRYAGAPISGIAYEVGFSDLSYFNRAFRRRFGMTPSEVRIDRKAAAS
jgi:AraC-like DNA-binding protein